MIAQFQKEHPPEPTKQMTLKRNRVCAEFFGLLLLLFALPLSAQPRPYVVLVSLDGFRADYLTSFPVENLRALAARGVRARWMQPSMPTLTFPNHYTMVTGLYPEHHGIVNNVMVDPGDQMQFSYKDSISDGSSRWWGGEPIWSTAEKQGVHSASFFWPGSEAEIAGKRPTFWKKYQESFPNAARVDTVLAWLSRNDALRPHFVSLYFSLVDHAGHDFGPWSPQTRNAAITADSMVGRLVEGVAGLGLTDSVDIVVVADHGMAPTPETHKVVLDDHMPPALLEIIQLSPFLAANARNGDVKAALAALRHVPHLMVFEKDSTPARWHYRDHRRIPQIVGVMDEGYELWIHGRSPPKLGDHGFDNIAPSMHALFVAAGPAFKSGVVAEPFQNIHIYDLLCTILGLRSAPNDGKIDSVKALLR
jgi:predicted AlkP superfamily pyrophosphatase or phosphodiesterase